MKKRDIFPAWKTILMGRRPFLSIEITRECPLHCPGCYAYDEGHLGNHRNLRQAQEYHGDDLIKGILGLIQLYQPLHLSIVGGEPLLRRRELDILLPRLNAMNMEVQFVTSAVYPIPPSWAQLSNLHLVVSIDGLLPEHDRRRTPATYDRILHNIAGHRIIVHCVIMPSMLTRPDYLRDFADFWSGRSETKNIWFSLYTPQQGEVSEERLTLEERGRAIDAIVRLKKQFPMVCANKAIISGYRHPPKSPRDCIFARTTTCISPDLKTLIMPCQLGGNPVCSECGCFASAGLASIGQYKLAALVKVGDIFKLSRWIGEKLHPHRMQEPAVSAASQVQEDLCGRN